MLARTARVVPCRARSAGRSELRVTIICPFSMAIPINGENARFNSPLGPFTPTLVPLISTCTPAGTVTGIRPTRDTLLPPLLPDLAEDFTANAQLTGALAGLDAP